VDPSADQIGISAVSGGEPCGSPVWCLLGGPRRVASLPCGRFALYRGRDPVTGLMRGVREGSLHTQGGGAGDPGRVARSFLEFRIRWIAAFGKHGKLRR
jgi:hypothetical protein